LLNSLPRLGALGFAAKSGESTSNSSTPALASFPGLAPPVGGASRTHPRRGGPWWREARGRTSAAALVYGGRRLASGVSMGIDLPLLLVDDHGYPTQEPGHAGGRQGRDAVARRRSSLMLVPKLLLPLCGRGAG
jgi:hypothetical protein